MDSYAPISEMTWKKLIEITSLRSLEKHQPLYQQGEIPKSFSYVVSGLLRSYITDEKGTEYNKNFFYEGTFPGSMTSLLMNQPSQFAIVSLEDSLIVEIDFKQYRKLLEESEDLKIYQIHYLEKNWLLAKDAREIAIVQENATQRYNRFLQDYPQLVSRLPQHHIASHLGITPTQLSRIRKKLQ